MSVTTASPPSSPIRNMYLLAEPFCFTPTELVNRLVVDESTLLTAYIVNGLEPDTSYKFYAVSLTVAGPSYENSSYVEAVTASAGIVAGHIAAISVAAFIALVFVVIGAVACIK